MLDIKWSSVDSRVARMSNFTERHFVLDTVECASLEGLLQSLKCTDLCLQKQICALSGIEAKRSGALYETWKTAQVLWWNQKPFARSSREYQDLLTKVYDSVYEQDSSFRDDLRAVGYEDICHSIGTPDMRDTVLTEVEMIYQLNRLRIRALRDG